VKIKIFSIFCVSLINILWNVLFRSAIGGVVWDYWTLIRRSVHTDRFSVTVPWIKVKLNLSVCTEPVLADKKCRFCHWHRTPLICEKLLLTTFWPGKTLFSRPPNRGGGILLLLGSITKEQSPLKDPFLTREPPQLIRSVWAHILLIGRAHSVDKNPKRIRAIAALIQRYSRFTELLAYHKVCTEKSNDDISIWNFVHK